MRTWMIYRTEEKQLEEGIREAEVASFRLDHIASWNRVDLLLGSRLPLAASTCSAGLPAGCRVDLPVHAALHTNREYADTPSFLASCSVVP